MNNYIKLAAEESKKADLIPQYKQVEFTAYSTDVPDVVVNAKHIYQYIMAQPVFIKDANMFTGLFRIWGLNEPADVFTRHCHKSFKEACRLYYCKPQNNIALLVWQHCCPNYQNIIKNGIKGVKAEIEKSKQAHKGDAEKLAYLEACSIITDAVVDWSNKCANEYSKAAENCADAARKAQLESVAHNCKNVPLNPAQSFAEGLQSMLICFQFLPDSIGTIDRFLKDLYFADINSGKITRDEAKNLLEEAFLYLSNQTPATSVNADRSAECHFAIGGYTENGEDGFNDLSRLVVESIAELDLRRPAISLRWTKKTPFEVLKFVLDAERHDKHKRIAIVSDEPRIKALTEIIGLTYEKAVLYTMVGCNEPAFPGALWKGGTTGNIARCIENLMHNNADILNCKTYEEFYAIFKQYLAADLNEIVDWHIKLDTLRAEDNSVMSAFLLDGCIENALSPTRGGCSTKIGGFEVMGLTCLIDSLTIVKQFVFDEKRCSMETLVNALKNNWQGYEELHKDILQNGKFFGNNLDISNGVAKQLSFDTKEILSKRKLLHGENIIVGTLAGYNAHYASFGALTKATPDGRMAGESFMVGTGQARGKDKNGLAALMQSVAQSDPTSIFCGAVVCNMLVDEAIIKNDESFEKFAKMVEVYFKTGGLHIQLNYVSKEELKAARENPLEHSSLKVRVSGFSATYVKLGDEIQLEILNRTEQK